MEVHALDGIAARYSVVEWYWYCAVLQAPASANREYRILVRGNTQLLWSSNRMLVSPNTTYPFDVTLEWFEQTVHVYFSRAVLNPGGNVYPAYNATLEVYESAMAQTAALTIETNLNGTPRVPIALF
jgi:hypothetical protein